MRAPRQTRRPNCNTRTSQREEGVSCLWKLPRDTTSLKEILPAPSTTQSNTDRLGLCIPTHVADAVKGRESRQAPKAKALCASNLIRTGITWVLLCVHERITK